MKDFSETSASDLGFSEKKTLKAEDLFHRSFTIVDASIQSTAQYGEVALLELLIPEDSFISRYTPVGDPVYETVNFWAWSNTVRDQVRSFVKGDLPCKATLLHAGEKGYRLGSPKEIGADEEEHPF